VHAYYLGQEPDKRNQQVKFSGQVMIYMKEFADHSMHDTESSDDMTLYKATPSKTKEVHNWQERNITDL
jgi:hypothetical protein